MNAPHDPQGTTDIPSASAKSLPRADPRGTTDHVADPLATTDQAPGSGSTVDFRPTAPLGADALAGDLPAVPGYRERRR
jgi:hypothetical protein